MRNSMKVFINRTSTWSRDSNSGYLSVENENAKLKRYIHYFVHCGIKVAMMWNQPKYPSMDGLTMKMWCVYTVDYYTIKKIKSCHMQQHRWPLRVTLRETSQKRKANGVWCTYIWYLKTKVNEKTKEDRTGWWLSLGRGLSNTQNRW